MEMVGIKVYWCDGCCAEYLYFEDDDQVNCCSLYTTINNKMYRWTTTASGATHLCYIEHPGVPGKTINRDTIILFSTKDRGDLPVVTPHTVKQKIGIYLLFI